MRKETVWAQAGRIGPSRLLCAHHSCLWGLWVNNSNSDANGLRQHCRRCLFLHSGVSIKFYWLLPKSRTASCCKSGLGFSRMLSWILREASLVENSSKFTETGKGKGNKQSCHMSSCLVLNLWDQEDFSWELFFVAFSGARQAPYKRLNTLFWKGVHIYTRYKLAALKRSE